MRQSETDTSRVEETDIMEHYGQEQADKNSIVARAASLLDWADYQEGSVVSRTIIDKETGSVTFFALLVSSDNVTLTGK